MQGRGGVHSFRKQREKMAGENLREGIVEVASEQWIEQGGCAGFIHRIKSPQVGSNVIPTLQGSSIGCENPVLAECRDTISDFRW